MVVKMCNFIASYLRKTIKKTCLPLLHFNNNSVSSSLNYPIEVIHEAFQFYKGLRVLTEGYIFLNWPLNNQTLFFYILTVIFTASSLR